MATSRATFIAAHLALALANGILGVGSVITKIGLAGCNPIVFALLREALAAPLLFGLSCALESRRESGTKFTRRDAFQFAVAGLMLFGTNLLFLIGVKVVGATPGSIWQSSLPVFTLLMGVLFGLEALTLLKVLGVLFAFGGCVFVTLYPSLSRGAAASSDSHGPVYAHLIFLVQMLSLAGFFIAEKPLLRKWTPLATLAYAYAVAAALMLLAGLLINSMPHFLDLICPDCHGIGWAVPRDAWFAIGYWVLLGSVASYYLLTWGNLYVDASMVGAYFTVQPIGAVVAALAVILATPNTSHYGLKGPGIQDIGAIGIFIGVGLLIIDARRQPQTSRTAQEEESVEERYEPLINGEQQQRQPQPPSNQQ